MKPMMEAGLPLDDIFEAAREAGRQLVEDGEMSAETLNIVSRELISPPEKAIHVINNYWRQQMNAAGVK